MTNTKSRYISDHISNEEIASWELGKKYLIRSGTGSGKSYFVKNNLYEFCKNKGHKILLLSNRTILRKQNEEDLGEEKLEIIHPRNYQSFENLVIGKDKSLKILLEPYKVIVFDEFHYVHSDSQFNRNTDILLELIRNPPQNKILLVITATPEILLNYYEFEKDKVYNIPTNYNYVRKIFFYTKEETPEALIQNMDGEEKSIYFGDANQAFELSNKFEDASFICAKNNIKYYKEKEMSRVVAQISEKSSFESRLLCTTKVLDNGVNIADLDLKNVIIDTLNPITLIQELGRKRVLNENDTINLYIRNQHRGIINFNLIDYKNGIYKQLKDLFDFENLPREEFLKKYRKKSYADVIDNDYSVNVAKRENLLYLANLYENLLKEKDSYKKMICNLLGKDISEAGNADMEIEKNSTLGFLETKLEKKLYKKEQEKFKQDFFNMIFLPKKTNYRHRALRSINAVLEEDNLPYRVTSGKDRGGESKKPETYWIVIAV